MVHVSGGFYFLPFGISTMSVVRTAPSGFAMDTLGSLSASSSETLRKDLKRDT